MSFLAQPSTLGTVPRGRTADLVSLAKLFVGYLVTLLLPRRLDRWAVGRVVRSAVGIRETWVRRVEGRMRQVFESRLEDADFRLLALEYCQMTREVQWMRWRAFHSSEVPAETSVEGLERIRRAQESGTGVILWGISFCETLPVKIALHRKGVSLVHLSSAVHGSPSPHTRLGMRVVGPLYSVPEVRFLAERVVIPPDESLGYLRVLRARLSEGACVYIRGDIKSSRNNVVAEVLKHEIEFAPGAPGLSWKLGAPLLPVHVVRDSPFRYRAVIHPRIEVDRELSKKHFIRAAVDRFVEVIERCALESPSSWEIAGAMWRAEWDR